MFRKCGYFRVALLINTQQGEGAYEDRAALFPRDVHLGRPVTPGRPGPANVSCLNNTLPHVGGNTYCSGGTFAQSTPRTTRRTNAEQDLRPKSSTKTKRSEKRVWVQSAPISLHQELWGWCKKIFLPDLSSNKAKTS
ncbi:unnamed protein product [Hapterophycus canaliculatus]